jgi:signal transduction histidine kinase/ligand-binding sensor domain-containing protein
VGSALYTSFGWIKISATLTHRIQLCLLAILSGLTCLSGPAAASELDLAETAGSIRVWHAADGLPSDSATAIVQTRDGFLWVGTTAGLVRFDGVKFTELKLGAASTNGPPRITALCEDSDGHLWIGTQQKGLFELSGGIVSHFGRRDGLLDENVTSLAADAHGEVWIGSRGGLNLWNGRQLESFTTRDGLSDEFVSGLNVARSGAVWITTRTGVCRSLNGRIVPYEFQPESQGRSPEYIGTYEDRSGNLWAFGDTYLINLAENKRFNYFRSSESASVRIWSLCEGKNGRIWIGTSGRGLFCFEANRFQPVTFGENRWPFDVRAIFEDREGNLWLGTYGGGLVQLRPHSVHILRNGAGLPNGPASALAVDEAGLIYAGFRKGGLFAGDTGKFDQFGASQGLEMPDFISSICVGKDGAVWAGTLGDGLYGFHDGHQIHYTTANCLADDDAPVLCMDAGGSLWAGSASGAVTRVTATNLAQFGPAQGLPRSPVTAMIPWSRGILAGTQSGQILRETDGSFSELEGAKNLFAVPVLSLYQGEQERLWIGTDGGGLACVKKGVPIVWTANNGLPVNTIAGIVEDQANNLWLATGIGIYRLNHSEILQAMENPSLPLKCELISEVKTAIGSAPVPGGPRAVLAPDGQLWFATSEGVMNIDTHQPGAEPALFPPCLESVALNGDPPVSLLRGAPWSTTDLSRRQFATPADLRSLEIHFTELTFGAPEELRFRHRLDGFDPDWVDDSNLRFVHYGRLPYGSYRFRVAARRGDGPWLEAAEALGFTVPTPFYFQAWALWLFGMLVVAFVVGIVRLVSHRRLRVALARLKQQQVLEHERMRIARDMHDEMGSKLTKISFLSERASAEAQSASPLAGKIESIAQTSRELLQTMDEIVWVVNPHNDTLDNLVAYLTHYAVEYFQNTTIECEMRLPPEVPVCPLSSEARHNLFLTFEEALNNVLKHSTATCVKVEMSASETEFEARVADNGHGFAVPAANGSSPANSERGGNGLKNMRQRLADIGGQCVIASEPGRGATVTIKFPLNRKGAKK